MKLKVPQCDVRQAVTVDELCRQVELTTDAATWRDYNELLSSHWSLSECCRGLWRYCYCDDYASC